MQVISQALRKSKQATQGSSDVKNSTLRAVDHIDTVSIGAFRLPRGPGNDCSGALTSLSNSFTIVARSPILSTC
jgi:hypothetical protein